MAVPAPEPVAGPMPAREEAASIPAPVSAEAEDVASEDSEEDERDECAEPQLKKYKNG